MVSLFNDIAVFHYQYKICISDGGESVGDYEAGSAFHEVIHGFLDLDFGSGVYGAGSFIEDQNLWISQDGSGDREELLLTLGYVAGFFVENHVVSAWKSLDETMYVGSFGCCYDFFMGGIEFAVFDIIFDASAEQPGILKYHSEHLSEFAPVEVFDVVSIDLDCPAVDIIETHQQFDHGCLSCSGWSYDGDLLSFFYFCREIIDDDILK